MKAISWSGDGLIPAIMVLAATFLIYKKDKLFAFLLLASTAGGFLLKNILQSAFQHDRPYIFGCEVLTKYADGYSFPSGHVMHYVIFFGMLLFFANKMKKEIWSIYLAVFAIINLVLIGYSRIYLGAHWANDIWGGYILGVAILYLTIKLYKNNTQEDESKT